VLLYRVDLESVTRNAPRDNADYRPGGRHVKYAAPALAALIVTRPDPIRSTIWHIQISVSNVELQRRY